MPVAAGARPLQRLARERLIGLPTAVHRRCPACPPPKRLDPARALPCLALLGCQQRYIVAVFPPKRHDPARALPRLALPGELALQVGCLCVFHRLDDRLKQVRAKVRGSRFFIPIFFCSSEGFKSIAGN